MKYQFEIGHEVTVCLYCPCYDQEYGSCNINDKDAGGINKPSWCPLVEVEG